MSQNVLPRKARKGEMHGHGENHGAAHWVWGAVWVVKGEESAGWDDTNLPQGPVLHLLAARPHLPAFALQPPHPLLLPLTPHLCE